MSDMTLDDLLKYQEQQSEKSVKQEVKQEESDYRNTENDVQNESDILYEKRPYLHINVLDIVTGYWAEVMGINIDKFNNKKYSNFRAFITSYLIISSLPKKSSDKERVLKELQKSEFYVGIEKLEKVKKVEKNRSELEAFEHSLLGMQRGIATLLLKENGDVESVNDAVASPDVVRVSDLLKQAGTEEQKRQKTIRNYKFKKK